jgi:hypothetical protein
VAFDGPGNLYIADLNNYRIRKVSAGGIITTVAGTGTPGFSGDGGPATAAELSGPQGVAVDGPGNLYIADTGNSRVRRISFSGIITTVAGNGTSGYSGDGGLATGAQLNDPIGVAVDGSGNLYIADEYNNSIRAILAGAGGLSAAGPSISTASTLPPGGVGAAYQKTLSATGGSSPYTWSLVSGALPGGLTLSSGGSISGTPATPGFYTFTLQAADNTTSTASLTFTLTIILRLSITSSSVLPMATLGTAYSQTLSAAGGSPPYSWSVASGSLPVGLALSSGGTIAGVPATAGSFGFGLQVWDSAATSAYAVFALTISPPAGCTYSIDPIGVSFTASGGTAGVTVIAAAGCPWTATSPLSWVTVTSGASGTGNGTVAIQVAANSDAARSGSITIDGQSFSISQSGAPCTYSIFPAGQAFPITGGSGNITVNTPSGCPWSVSSLPNWVTVTSGASGSGNGTVAYQTTANSGAWRTATFAVAGASFVVEQSSATLGSLTTVGAMPQVATAGGWQTSIVLVNLGTTSAQARLNFFDDNGAAVVDPLSFPQAPLGGTFLAAQLERTVAPGAALVIQTCGTGVNGVSSWAQLQSNGSITGFARFNWTMGAVVQEAVVPLESRSPSSFVLYYDQTGGFATGVAVANVVGQSASVAVTVRDDTGTAIGSETLPFSSYGHIAYLLTDHYPATAQGRGTIEFKTPPGGQIATLGLRAGLAGTLSTIPAMIK